MLFCEGWKPSVIGPATSIHFCINLSYSPKDQSLKIWWKNIETWWIWKTQFFSVGHFGSFSFLFFHFFFLFSSSPLELVTNYGAAWMGLNFYDYHDFQPKLGETLYVPHFKKKGLLQLPYESPILGQFLDLISPPKINTSEPRFESYDPWDMANWPAMIYYKHIKV